MHRNIELLILMAACVSPLFLFASTIDGDEFLKGGAGVAFGASIVGMYRLWKGKRK